MEFTGGNYGGGNSGTNARLFGKNLFADEFEGAAEFAAAPGFAVPVGEAANDPSFVEVGAEKVAAMHFSGVINVETPALGHGAFDADLADDTGFEAPDFVAGFVRNYFPTFGGRDLDGGGVDENGDFLRRANMKIDPVFRVVFQEQVVWNNFGCGIGLRALGVER